MADFATIYFTCFSGCFVLQHWRSKSHLTHPLAWVCPVILRNLPKLSVNSLRSFPVNSGRFTTICNCLAFNQRLRNLPLFVCPGRPKSQPLFVHLGRPGVAKNPTTFRGPGAAEKPNTFCPPGGGGGWAKNKTLWVHPGRPKNQPYFIRLGRTKSVWFGLVWSGVAEKPTTFCPPMATEKPTTFGPPLAAEKPTTFPPPGADEKPTTSHTGGGGGALFVRPGRPTN